MQLPKCICCVLKVVLTAFFKFWLKVYGEPDQTDVIIFNEEPRTIPGMHINGACRKKCCETCRVERIISYINKAKVSIDLALLTFSHHDFFKAIMDAFDRGAQVRIVTDSQMAIIIGSAIAPLQAKNIEIHESPPHLMMHHKFCIIDGEMRVTEIDNESKNFQCRLWDRKGFVVTGSLNWTKQGTNKNYENVVVTSNRKVIEDYQKIFNTLWNTFQLHKPL